MFASLAQYHPHGVCYLWESDLLWTHAISDGLIALAYYSIPVGLVYFVRKRKDLPFDWIFVAFATFILACGTTHAMAIWTLWSPDYWASAWVKIVTAGASVATAALLVPLIPKAVELPSPTQLQEANEALRASEAENRALTQDLQRRLEELEEVNQELNSFARSVSHDLQAPLRAMEGFAEALLDDYGPQLDEYGQEYTERIADSSRRMSRMIEELLEYSRLVRAEFEVMPVELRQVVDDVVASLDETIRTEGADVNVDVGDTVAMAHRSTLRRLVSNLLVNALTYVEPGSTPRVTVRTEDRDDRVRLVVEDEGIGIPKDQQEKIFRVFERLHSREEFEGTGIGLAEVRKGAERMGGSVGVDSEPGEGSRFWIELEKGARA